MARPRQKPTPDLGPLIRKRRKALGLTLQAACDRMGLSVGYLSQVERDYATPSLGTLAQIAQALDVGVKYFISVPWPADSLTRQGGRAQFTLDDSSIVYEALGTDFPDAELSSYVLNVPPGYVSEIVSHDGEEIIYVLEGTTAVLLGDEQFQMRAGGSLHYSGKTRHAWSNPGDAPARILRTGTLNVLQGKGARLPEMTPANDQNPTNQ